ncbi:MAG: right-handed parallel beta-helix repeat-containing protein [Sandaracinaceae bacterium]
MPRLLACMGALALVASGCGLTIDYVPEDGSPGQDAATAFDGGVAPGDAATDAARDGSPDGGNPDQDAGPVCLDEDGDGVTDCDGDCDDGDPTRHPGALTICGDGVTQDCSAGAEDAVCGGLGTFVSSTTGSDANPGTQAMPVATIAQGIAHAMTIGGGVDVFVAEGLYPEDVTLVDEISLVGGHDPASWRRDPASHVSTIRPPSFMGVRAPSGVGATTALDGFRVEARGGPSTGTAVTILAGAEPVISNNTLIGPDNGGASRGVAINPANMTNTGVRPTLFGNTIQVGRSGSGWGGGNGGWGVYAVQTTVDVVGNTILLSEAHTIQRGVELFGCPDGRVSKNDIRGVSGPETVFGIRVASSGATVDGNLVTPGVVDQYGLGIALEGNITRVVVTNNIARGGDSAEQFSAGLWVAFERAPTTRPDVVVHSNFFAGGAARGWATSAGAALVLESGGPLTLGRFTDNILFHGSTGRGAAFIEYPSGEIDPERFVNNALHDPSAASAATGPSLYLDEGSSRLTMIGDVNRLAGASGNLRNDCGLLGLAGGDYHLPAGSVCVDAGDATEMPPEDFEGDARPLGAGPDIGPDERVP